MVSTRTVQSATKAPEWIQGMIGMMYLWPFSATSLNATSDSARETNNSPVVTSSEARAPMTRPNRPAMTEPMMGRKTMAAYISALHHVDVLNRDGAAVAEIDHKNGKPDCRLGGGDGEHEQGE